MDLRKNQHLSHLKFTLPRFANRELSLRPFCAPTACALLAWCRAIVTMKYVMCGRAPCLRVSNASGVNHGAGLSATQLPRPPPVPAPDAQPNVARHDVLWVQRNPEQGRNRRPRRQVPVRNGDQPDPKQRPDPAASLQASLQARCALQAGLCINQRIHNCGEQPAPLPTDPWAIIKSPYGGKLSPNDQWVILSSQGASHKPAVHVGLSLDDAELRRPACTPKKAYCAVH